MQQPIADSEEEGRGGRVGDVSQLMEDGGQPAEAQQLSVEEAEEDEVGASLTAVGHAVKSVEKGSEGRGRGEGGGGGRRER